MNISSTTEAAASGLDRAARWTGAAMVAGFAAMVVYVVISRYLFSSTPRWAEELPRLLLVWLTFTGAVSCFIRRTHFRAGLLDLMPMPALLRRAFALLAGLASATFLVVLAVNGARLTGITWSHQTTALSLPVGLFYLALPVCGGTALLGMLLKGGRA